MLVGAPASEAGRAASERAVEALSRLFSEHAPVVEAGEEEEGGEEAVDVGEALAREPPETWDEDE